jgi:hypothetical protein
MALQGRTPMEKLATMLPSFGHGTCADNVQ